MSFSVSGTGTLAYKNRQGESLYWEKRQLCWLDRSGKLISVIGDTASYLGVRLSHDNQKIACMVKDARRNSTDIWVRDLSRGVSSRITFDCNNFCPLWSPDDRKVLYAVDRDGRVGFVTKSADGLGNEEVILRFMNSDSIVFIPQSWSSDGSLIACVGINMRNEENPADIYLFKPGVDTLPQPFISGTYADAQPAFSPDGAYLAYTSNETGVDESHDVYVISLGTERRRWKITNGGGGTPMWSNDGTELYFTHKGDSLVAISSVAVKTKPSFKVGSTTKLFEGSYYAPSEEFSLWRYGISSDKQRFIANRGLYGPDRGNPEFDVIINWSAEVLDE
jgi:Tol biopolymer transport system component